jgi:hypothetical protein
MTDYESNKINSFNATSEVMTRNEAIWNTSLNAKNKFGEITAKLPLFTKYHQSQKNGPSISITLKKGAKESLIKMGLKISDSAVDYAAGKKDKALELKVTLTESRLKRYRQLPLYDALSAFYDIVEPIKADLSHLEATDIATFKTMLDDYKQAIPEAEADNDSSRTATQNMGELIREVNGLYNDLDKHIRPFRYKFPDFVSDYFFSRNYKNFRGRGKSEKKEEGENK